MINSNQIEKEKKYTKLLNNLLDIKRGDSSILTKTSTKNFDLFVMFKNNLEALKKIFENKTFILEITTDSISNLIEELTKLLLSYETYEDKLLFGQEVKSICEQYDFHLKKVFENGLIIEKEIKVTLENIISNLQIEKQQFVKKWMKYKKEINDEINQKGISPLYVGTCFLKGTNLNEFYAFNGPLFLKEINIEVLKNKIKIFSNSNWIINEKLIFYLEKMGYFVSDSMNYEEKDFLELIRDVLSSIKVEVPTDILFFIKKFTNFKKEQIKNKKIEINPGLIMGWFNPEGGYLRKLMWQIIDNDEIESIIDTNPNKIIYENKIKNELENNYEKLIKIQSSNFSQDRALVSSLVQDTIIWGPPGTGKSQVIANIIANILYQNKSAIIMSQKIAALNVIKKRMGKLSKFLLFSFDYRQTKKEEFYEQLNAFLSKVEYSNFEQFNYIKKNNPLITNKQMKILNIIHNLKVKGEYDSIIESYKLYGDDYKKMESISSLNLNYDYPLIGKNNEKSFLENLATLNNVKKYGYIFWWKYKDKFIKECKAAFEIASENQINDLEKYIKPFKRTKFENIQLIAENSSILDYRDSEESLVSEEDLEHYLATLIAKKINNWNLYDSYKIKLYKNFSNAVRAKRRLPNKFINDHITIINELFPIIVTTPEQVFINYNKNHFDYAIVDESSQIFLELGLPILYLAKIKVVAGDTEQMRPTSWFSSRDIADEYEEQDVEENAISLLDYAKDKGINEILLDQNYRADSASLMSFSAKEYYKSDLEVIDKIDKSTANPIEVLQVNGEWYKGTNEKEARIVIKLLKENYKKYNNIIILAFNIKQKQLMENLILNDEPQLWNKVEHKSISIRNIENIQGDEAELVIMSVVYTSETRIMGTYIARKGGRNALNVAISRAKSKMIIVKSIEEKRLANGSGEDYEMFRKWLYFLDCNKDIQRTYSIQEIKHAQSYSDSDFEEEVYNKLLVELNLIKDNLKLGQQYPVGSKRIDIAVLDQNNNYILGIEVDGYNYHSTIDQYLSDISRENFIKSKGYDIVRIKDINWYLNPDKEIKKIQNIINNKLKLIKEHSN
ncbi:MAG: AAA domain-containing protein [Spiroplasma sp.]